MRYYASLEATSGSSHNSLGYWGNFHVLEKLGVSLARVFSANECLNGLRHRNKAPLGTHLGVKTQ